MKNKYHDQAIIELTGNQSKINQIEDPDAQAAVQKINDVLLNLLLDDQRGRKHLALRIEKLKKENQH